MNKVFKFFKVFFGVMLCFLVLFFLAYQVYNAFYSPYETETVTQLDNEDKIEVDGIFLRNEEIVEADHNGYIVHYLYSDGKKIGAGGTVAELYANESDVLNYEKIKELNELVEILEESQDQSSVLVTNADHVTNQINNKIKEFSSAVYKHDYEAIEKCKDDMQILLNRRNIITEKEKNFSGYISKVKGQIDSLKSKIKNPLKAVKVQKNGNFVISVDGFENKARYSTVSQMSVTEAEELILSSTPETVSGKAIGKLVTDFDWYYTMILPIDDRELDENIKIGSSLKIRFNSVSDEILNVTVSKVTVDEASGKMAVTVKSNYLNEKFCSARKEKADLIFSSVKGYKIKKSAVRIVDDKKGVYVVIGKQMFFRKIDVLYEIEDYVVCKISSGNGTLKPFDDVIVKGTDLYDGKTI